MSALSENLPLAKYRLMASSCHKALLIPNVCFGDEADCDGFILTPNCRLAHRKTYDDGLDKQSFDQSGQFKAAQAGTRFPQ
jgi:hypothetical protein